MTSLIDGILTGTLLQKETAFRNKVKSKTSKVADWQPVEHAYSSGVFDSVLMTTKTMAWVEFKVKGRVLTDAQPAWAKEKLKWTPNLFVISLKPRGSVASVYQVTSDPAIKGRLMLIAEVPLDKTRQSYEQLVAVIEDRSLKFITF